MTHLSKSLSILYSPPSSSQQPVYNTGSRFELRTTCIKRSVTSAIVLQVFSRSQYRVLKGARAVVLFRTGFYFICRDSLEQLHTLAGDLCSFFIIRRLFLVSSIGKQEASQMLSRIMLNIPTVKYERPLFLLFSHFSS